MYTTSEITHRCVTSRAPGMYLTTRSDSVPRLLRCLQLMLQLHRGARRPNAHASDELLLQ